MSKEGREFACMQRCVSMRTHTYLCEHPGPHVHTLGSECGVSVWCMHGALWTWAWYRLRCEHGAQPNKHW